MRDEIQGQIANATSEKAQSLANMFMQEYSKAQDYLRNLDAMVQENKMNLETWKTQRESEFDYYLKELEAASKYETGTYGYDTGKIAGSGQKVQTQQSPTSQNVGTYTGGLNLSGLDEEGRFKPYLVGTYS